MVDGRSHIPAVQIGILTIRDDAFKAVLNAFPDNPKTIRGIIANMRFDPPTLAGGQRYKIAVLKQIEQGNGGNTLFDTGDPTTIRVARRVGDILKHFPAGRKVNSRFRYFT